MLKKIFVFLLLILVFTSGCFANSPDKKDNNSGVSERTSSSVLSMLPIPDGYVNTDELLLNIGKVKFSELDKSHNFPQTITALQSLYALYKPGYIKPSFIAGGISVDSVHRITLFYEEITTGEYAVFKWQRFIAAENATKDFLRGNSAEEYMEERNGITYAVKEYANETGVHSSYEVGWAQHGQTFNALLSASFTLEEVLAFCNAQPIAAWELLGDAVSVSIQGMENVSIYDEADNTVIVEGDILYRGNSGVPGAIDMERIGYRWLINESAYRYQYVLEPNEYIFHADSPIGEPEILVKHFTAGECVSEESFNKIPAEQSIIQFTLSVTPNPAENTLAPQREDY